MSVQTPAGDDTLANLSYVAKFRQPIKYYSGK